MTHSIANASSFLVENSGLFDDLGIENGVLDLACGMGRNGLFLFRNNVPVIFADNNEAHLQFVSSQLDHSQASANRSEIWLVDFEAEAIQGNHPLSGKTFDAVIVFNYLHRALFPLIREAIRPGGLIVYETFTLDNKRFGRPNNPDFLLQSGELEREFAEWEIIESFEGEVPGPERSIARIIARKQAE
jgi:tellurite methyltransferase